MCKTWRYSLCLGVAVAVFWGGWLLQAGRTQPPEETPETVFQNFLELTRTRQIAQAQSLWTEESQKKFNFAQMPEEQFDTLQRVMLLLYLPPENWVKPVPQQGEETEGAIISMYKLVGVNQQFALRQEKGQWRIDLLRSAAQSPLPAATQIGPPPLGAAEMDMETARWLCCASNLKRLTLAILMYAQDHQETLPPAETWGDAILPYLYNNEWYFVCPSAPDLVCGYAYNATYSEKKLGEIPHPEESLLLWDSDPGEWNHHQDGSDLSPADRHQGQINAGYVDGHTIVLDSLNLPGEGK